jgi:PAS domain S-box-containing protein
LSSDLTRFSYELAKNPVFLEGSRALIIEEVVRLCSRALNLERPSFWILDEQRTTLVQELLYLRSTGALERGAELCGKRYRTFFKALSSHRVIVADDARQHELTRDFRDDLLIPLGIVSMLDSPVFVDGKLIGVLCLAHVGEPRKWSESEQVFATATADHLGRALEGLARRELLQQIGKSEAKYRALVEQIPAVVYIGAVDPGETSFISPQIFNMLGYTVDEWLESPDFWKNRLHPEDRDEALREAARSRDSGNLAIEYRLKSNAGSYRWIRDEATIVRDESGKALFLQGVMMDITSRRDTEQALQESRDQLMQSQKLEAVGRLAGGVAHDFNNLLTAILGYAEVGLRQLEQGQLDTRPLNEIRKAGERAAAVTQQLLALSRKQVPSPTVVHLRDELRELRPMLERLLGDDVRLEIRSDEDLHLVLVDPSQLQQVILNLTVNAHDAMPGGGTLTLELRNLQVEGAGYPGGLENGQYVRLIACDNGCGIDPDVISNIFEPFFTTKEAGKGTGLGLSMVYGIVEQNGGRIFVDSELGSGTLFEIWLPTTDEQLVQDSLQGFVGEAADISGRVLLVEDEDALRELIADYMSSLGYEVEQASSAEQALARIGGNDDLPFLLITDVSMPGMSGPELARILRELDRELRVLFISGYSFEALNNEGKLDDGVHLLEKPFPLQRLAGKIREVLAAPRG